MRVRDVRLTKAGASERAEIDPYFVHCTIIPIGSTWIGRVGVVGGGGIHGAVAAAGARCVHAIAATVQVSIDRGRSGEHVGGVAQDHLAVPPVDAERAVLARPAIVGTDQVDFEAHGRRASAVREEQLDVVALEQILEDVLRGTHPRVHRGPHCGAHRWVHRALGRRFRPGVGPTAARTIPVGVVRERWVQRNADVNVCLSTDLLDDLFDHRCGIVRSEVRRAGVTKCRGRTNHGDVVRPATPLARAGALSCRARWAARRQRAKTGPAARKVRAYRDADGRTVTRRRRAAGGALPRLTPAVPRRSAAGIHASEPAEQQHRANAAQARGSDHFRAPFLMSNERGDLA